MLNKTGEIKLVAHGRQKKGWSETGTEIMKRINRPLGNEELEMFKNQPDLIPESWKGKIAIFWGTVTLAVKAPHIETFSPEKYPAFQVIGFEPSWVKGLFLSGGSWKVESFPVDDDFSANRLSAELVKVPWWKVIFYKLIGKNI